MEYYVICKRTTYEVVAIVDDIRIARHFCENNEAKDGPYTFWVEEIKEDELEDYDY